jgi:hypothetical protein
MTAIFLTEIVLRPTVGLGGFSVGGGACISSVIKEPVWSGGRDGLCYREWLDGQRWQRGDAFHHYLFEEILEKWLRDMEDKAVY